MGARVPISHGEKQLRSNKCKNKIKRKKVLIDYEFYKGSSVIKISKSMQKYNACRHNNIILILV